MVCLDSLSGHLLQEKGMSHFSQLIKSPFMASIIASVDFDINKGHY